MRLDTVRLHAQLSDAVRTLEEGISNDLPPEAGPLWALGRLLFELPLAALVCEVRARHFRPPRNVAERLSLQLAPPLLERAIALAENLNVLQVSGLAIAELHQARTHAASMRDAIERGDLEAGRLAHANELIRLISVLAHNQPSDLALASATADMSRNLAADVGAAVDRVRSWSDLSRSLDVSSALDQFEAAYRFVAAVVGGDEFPREVPPSLRDVSLFRGPARRLANDVLTELALRPQIHQSILRLRVHLESHIREEVLSAMRAAETTNYHNERVLQKAMDRFLFAEGLFPLTHFELANGSVDSAFESKRISAIEQVPLLQTPPALIELKQAVVLDGDGPTASDVRAAVEDGARQASRYRGSLRALWPSHAVYAVVVYNGPAAYLINPAHDQVLLVYLGEASPSGAKKNLAVELGAF